MAEISGQRKKLSAASAPAHTRSSNATSPFKLSLLMIVISLLGWAFLEVQPPPPKLFSSPAGLQVTSPRIKLHDGRYLAYKERGVNKEEAKYKIILIHGFDNSKDITLPVSQDLLLELRIRMLSFDRAGYGDSDPNPNRSVKSEAYDIQELADKLEIGAKFHIIGVSLGAYPVWSCLKHIPNRLSGAALVVPHVNYWWRCFPDELSKAALKKQLVQDQWSYRVAHYTPWLFYWWITQKWFPSLSLMEENVTVFSTQDHKILEQLSGTLNAEKEKVKQQGVYESLVRDMLVAFGNWGFDPTDIPNPFPNNEGSVHIWQGYEDRIFPFELNRYISQKLQWIRYHEVRDVGHLLIYDTSLCEAVLRELLSS